MNGVIVANTVATAWHDASLRGATLLLLAWGLAFVLRRFPGQLRYRLWSAVFVGLFLLPMLSALLPVWHPPAAVLSAAARALPSPDMVVVPEVAPLALVPVVEAAFTAAAGPARTSEPQSSPGAARRVPWRSALLALWALGALVALCRLASAIGRVSRVVGRGLPLDESWSALLQEAMERVGCERPARLVESYEVTTPMTGGLIQPVILLPRASRNWSSTRRRLVLLHELVHVRRGDWLLQMVARMVCVFHWWNPLAWLAGRRLEFEREAACDEAVLDLGALPSEYASHLLAIVEEFRRPKVPALATLAMAQPTQLEGRLMSILTPRSIRFRDWQAVPVVAGMACLVLLLATLKIEGETGPEDLPSGAETFSEIEEGGVGIQHQKRLSGNWAMDTTRADGLRFTVRVQGVLRTNEDLAQIELDPGSVLELETRADGRTARLEIVGVAAGETTETFWVDGIVRPLDEAGRRFREAAFATFREQQEQSAFLGKVGALKGQIGALRGREGALRGELGALHGREGALRGQVGALKGRVGAMHGEIGAIRGRAAAMKGHLGALRSEMATLRAQGGHGLVNKSLEDKAQEAARKAEMEAHLSALEAETREVEAQLADFNLEGKVAEIEAQIAAMDAEKQERQIQAQLSALHTAAEIAETERRIASLETEAEVAEIEREMEALGVEEQALELQSRLEERYKELRRTMDELIP